MESDPPPNKGRSVRPVYEVTPRFVITAKQPEIPVSLPVKESPLQTVWSNINWDYMTLGYRPQHLGEKQYSIFETRHFQSAQFAQ